MPHSSHLLLTLLTTFTLFLHHCHARTFTFEMHHAFSEPLKKYAHLHSHNASPQKGTISYYSALADRDRLLLRLKGRGRSRRRLSSSIGGSVTLFDGNSTIQLSSMGFLHYTTVSLGTPSKKFLVALDTGSDLFWVPCDCASCASTTTTTSYGSDYEAELSVYHPQGSSTSKKIMCDNSLCTQQNRCVVPFSNCQYKVSYISADTSTSGVLVEDVLHLIAEDDQPEVVDAWITFGCGQVQTGSFLEFAAPNGLFGLGMENISVPSMLSQAGLIEDSFSMCFGHDGFGRISFGDKGSSDQDETPFNLDLLHPTYNISVTEIRVGSSLIDTQFDALVDSGTSFTYMMDPAYAQLSESFNLEHTQDSRVPRDSRVPFEYCYRMSTAANSSLIPSISLIMKGGSQYLVYDPIIVISNADDLVYCLAVVKSNDLNIIGQNFMTGYKVVFDREKLVLGWKKFDCYNLETLDTQPTNAGKSTEVSTGPGSCTVKDNEDYDNISLIPVNPTPHSSSSPHWTYNFRLALFAHFLHTVVFVSPFFD